MRLQLDDLLDGHTYAVKVRAHVGFGPGQMVLGWSNFSEAVTCPQLTVPPLSPRRLRRATDTLHRDAFDLTWEQPAALRNDVARGSAASVGWYTVKYREVDGHSARPRHTTPPSSDGAWIVADVVSFTSSSRTVRITGLLPNRYSTALPSPCFLYAACECGGKERKERTV